VSALQIKDIPEPLHAELRRRSAARNQTMRDYVLELIRRDQALPAPEDWLAGLEGLTPVPGVSGAALVDLIHEGRARVDRR